MRQKTLLSKLMLLLWMFVAGVGSVCSQTATYQHVFNAKPSTGNNVTLSSVSWNITATSLNGYNSANYAGVQIGSKSADGSITLTSSSAWNYNNKSVIKEVRLWLNLGGTSVTPTVTIGGVDATSDGTTVVKNSSAGSDWTKATKVTFTPASNGNTGVIVINVETVKAGYICAMEIDCDEAGSTPTVATPTFTPDEGIYTSAQNVTISTTTAGATIYYTTDGTDPTANSSVYSSAIPVSTTTTIKAMAVAEGYDNSAVATAAYTIVSLAHAGTEQDPYTVADARAAIDANVGIENVYATGIVKEITTAYNSQYSNITFDIIDEGGSDILRAYRCTGNDAANVAVGDEVVVSGNLTKYNDIYEFSSGCQLVSLTHPVNTNPSIEVSSASINVPAAMTEGTINVTYNNITNVAAELYFYSTSEATTTTQAPEWIVASLNASNQIEYIINENDGEARTAYMKVYALDDNSNDVYSELITITQAAPVIDYATLPFTYDGNGTGTLPAGFTCEGLSTYNSSPKMQFNSTGDWAILKINGRPGTLKFDIKGNSFSGGTFKVQTSEDGTTYTDLATYSELGSTQSEEFSNLGENVRYIKWVYTTKSSGNVALGNIALAAYVAPSNSAPVWSELPTPTIAVNEEYELNLSAYVTGTPTPDISLSTSVSNTLYEFEDGLLMFQPTEAGTYEFTFTAENSEGSENATLTVTAEAITTNTYTLATAITSGKHYVIASGTSGDVKVMGAQNNNNRAAVGGSVSGTTLSVASNAGAYEFVIYGPDADGYYTIYDAVTPGYLYAVGGTSNNHLKTETTPADHGHWTINLENNDDEDGASIVANISGRNTMRYNSSNDIFSCYASDGQNAIYLYEKSSESTPTESKTLNSYGYATYCSQNALDFSNNSNVTAWAISSANSSTGVITFSQLKGKVAAGTGMLLKGDASTEVTLTSATGKDDVSGNLLIGTTADFVVENNGDYYGLSGKEFVPVNAGTVPAGKALLPASEVGSAARLSFVFEDDNTTTGISTMHNSEFIMHNEVYNLNGQRVNDLKKGGLYIVGGKKVIVK